MNPLLKEMVEAERKLDENFVVNGKVYLVRCPKCDRENWALSVSSGRCCWCGFDANKDKLEEETEE